MDSVLRKRRRRWKIKNLGYRGWVLSLLQKKRYIVFKEIEESSYKEVEVEPVADWKPFMLVKPSGYAKLEIIRKILEEKGVNIEGEYEISDYNEALQVLFPSVERREKEYWKQINDQYYSSQGNSRACILQFDEACPVSLLEQLKIVIRRRCGIDFFYVIDKDREIYETSVTPVHVPDAGDMKKEYAQVMYCIHKKSDN